MTSKRPSRLNVTEPGQLTCGELHRILANAAIFASRDDTLPMLNCVHLEADRKSLTAVATDRFTVGATNIPYTCKDPFELSIPLEQVFVIMKMLRPSSSKARMAAKVLLFSDDDWRTLTVEIVGGTILTIPLVPNGTTSFPKWRQFVPPTPASEETGSAVFGVSLSKVAQFSRVQSGGYSPVWRVREPQQPIGVAIGDFLGLVMPIRLDSEQTWQVPDWAATTPEPIIPTEVKK